jgi:hypothetical protein
VLPKLITLLLRAVVEHVMALGALADLEPVRGFL